MDYEGSAYYEKTLGHITDFETWDDFLELYNGEYDCTETFISTSKRNDVREIIDFISFVYDIPKEQILLKFN